MHYNSSLCLLEHDAVRSVLQHFQMENTVNRELNHIGFLYKLIGSDVLR